MAEPTNCLLVALGANLPSEGSPPEATLRKAIALFPRYGLTVLAVSRLYRTPCFPAGAGPDYVNAAARIGAGPDLEAQDILDALHKIEAGCGRERAVRWGMRTLDLDLLAFGDDILPDAATQSAWRGLAPDAQVARTPDRLIVPHPRLQDRAFVLVPLADVAPDWRHPLLGLTVREMRDRLPPADLASVQPL